MNFSPKPLLFDSFFKNSFFVFSQPLTPNIFSIVFPNPPLSLPLVINLLPSSKLFPPLFLFSNLPNPSLYNDEELIRSLKISSTSHKKLSSHCIASCYRLFGVTALQFDVNNMFTVIGPVFLQKLYP